MPRLRHKHSETGPRNRPLRPQGYDLPPVRGRRRRDWRHNLFQDQVGWAMLILVSAPIVYGIGRLLEFW